MPYHRFKKIIFLLSLFNVCFYTNAQLKLSSPLKLCADNRTTKECFGWSCILYKNYCLIGTPEKNMKIKGNYLQETGIVYIYERKAPLNWELKQKISSPNVTSFDFFGGSISMTDSFIVVGAAGVDDSLTKNPRVSNGAVFVYKKNKVKWYLHQTIKLAEINYANRFGSKVLLNNNRLYVNAINKRKNIEGNNSTGGIFIYELNSAGLWELKKQLLPPEKNLLMFGSEFAVENNLLLVNAENMSKAFLFQLEDKDRSLNHELIHSFSNPQKEDEGFGNELALHKGQIIIASYGSFEHNDNLPDDDSLVLRQRQKLLKGAGCIYIYEGDTGKYALKQKLIAKDNKADLHFGNCIAVNDTLMLVGAFGDKLDRSCANNRYAGAAYLFAYRNGQWKQLKKITSPKRAIWDKFGFSVSIDNNYIMVGSRFDEEDVDELNPLDEAGSAYIYKIIK